MKTIINEFKRLWIFIAISAFMLFIDPVSALYVLFGLGCISIVMVFAHLVRKILHPYVNLQSLYEHASTTPVSAAIVLCSFIYLVTTVLNVVTLFIK